MRLGNVMKNEVSSFDQKPLQQQCLHEPCRLLSVTRELITGYTVAGYPVQQNFMSRCCASSSWKNSSKRSKPDPLHWRAFTIFLFYREMIYPDNFLNRSKINLTVWEFELEWICFHGLRGMIQIVAMLQHT